MIKKFVAIAGMTLALSGCQNLSNMLATNPTVVAVVDGIRVGCNWEANSSDVQALLNSGIPGLKTVDNYVGAFCAAAQTLPVAAAPGGVPVVRVGPVAIHAQRAVK